MTAPSLKRPHFHNPPIFEQVISVAFDRIRNFTATDFGMFLQRISFDFPNTDMAPRLAIGTELFEGQGTSIPLEIVGPIALPRVVYKSSDASEMVQVQDDFFAFNWVNIDEGGSYPRFERTSEQLWKHLSLFREFIKERHGIEIGIRQAEITNVNIVPIDSFGEDYNDIAAAFIVDPFDWNVPGLVAETYVRQRVHRIVNDESQPLGRLYSNIAPVLNTNGEKAFKFELTARSSRKPYSDQELTKFLDKAHTMINGAFMASVTARMKKIWREHDVE